MQGSFEKKVQEKLDELKLTPSAPVWEKIELQIQPEQGRRRGLFWLPLLLLLLGAGWWLLKDGEAEIAPSLGEPVNTTASPAQEQPTTSGKTTALAPTDKSSSETKKSVAISEQQLASKQLTAITVKKGTSVDRQALLIDKTPLQLTTKGEENNSFTKRSVYLPPAKQAGEPPLTPGKSGDATITGTNKERSPIDQILANKMPNGAITSEAPIVDKEVGPRVNVTTKDSAAKETGQQPVAKDTVATRRKIAAVGKWKWTMTARVGWAGASSSLSSVSRDAYASPTQSNGGLNTGSIRPNTISGGSSYAVSIALTRSVGSRLQLSAGLQYASYQSRTKIGAYRSRDTSLFFRSQSVNVGGYYYNGQQQDYTIRHQVLEFPISIGYQPVRSWPLFISAGASYGRVLKSNALTFNPTGNFYFESKDNVSRNQVGLFSALQYRILHRKSFELSAGPALQYQLTSFQKDATTNKPTLLFAGVKTSVNF
jgi:hypothetical protein